MPCQSEYMERNAREIESVEVAQHLCYLDDCGWCKVGPEIRKAAEYYYGNTGLLDPWTADLCHMLSIMGEDEQARVLYDGRKPKARKLADWWERHQAADRKREAEERTRGFDAIIKKQQENAPLAFEIIAQFVALSGDSKTSLVKTAKRLLKKVEK